MHQEKSAVHLTLFILAKPIDKIIIEQMLNIIEESTL